MGRRCSEVAATSVARPGEGSEAFSVQKLCVQEKKETKIIDAGYRMQRLPDSRCKARGPLIILIGLIFTEPDRYKSVPSVVGLSLPFPALYQSRRLLSLCPEMPSMVEN